VLWRKAVARARLLLCMESAIFPRLLCLTNGDDFSVAAAIEVVVPVRLHLVSRTHRKEMTANAAHVWTFREGKIVRHCVFSTKADALAAAGLSEYRTTALDEKQ